MNRSGRKIRSSCAEEEVCSNSVIRKRKNLATAGVVRDSAFIVQVEGGQLKRVCLHQPTRKNILANTLSSKRN
jgi:hypothetical protein